MDKKLKKRQAELIDYLGVFFVEDEHLTPIEGRILALIILFGKQGVTFEDIITELSIGKSTASSYLEDLQKRKRIEFYMKEGDRKRYFIVKRDSLNTSFAKLEEQWTTRRINFERVLNFQKDCMLQGVVSKDNFDVDFLIQFIKYAGEVIQSIRHLRNEMTKFN
ncbi:MAG: MarR family transcriptional regulator [Brumimicrobium sp.]|nr:MarR family transcriptional regulator [Brumimicrobium sp.]MCO5268679.1 MarR family transcriptional regulator [Brumimicrobium sp.]